MELAGTCNGTDAMGENCRGDETPAAAAAPHCPISKAVKAELLMGENFRVVLDHPLCPELGGHEEVKPWGVPASSRGSNPISRCTPSWGELTGGSVEPLVFGKVHFVFPSPVELDPSGHPPPPSPTLLSTAPVVAGRRNWPKISARKLNGRGFVYQTGACLCQKVFTKYPAPGVREDKFFNHVKMIYLNVKPCHLTSFHFSNCLCFFWMINLSSDSLNMTN